MTPPLILGIWDGHDSGTALVSGSRILFAVNEERFTRRKSEVRFPEQSIGACLRHLGAAPGAVSHIAISTADPAKTLGRLFPYLKEEYYQFRRRKKDPGRLDRYKRLFKYRFTQMAPNVLSRRISAYAVRRRLRALGFATQPLLWTNHHAAHAATAAFCSGFDRALTLTLDGIGDGLSGSVWLFESGRLQRLSDLAGKSSLGIFYEQVTALLNMRELEDEGKVMALSNYAYPIQEKNNPMMDFFAVDGLNLRARLSASSMYRELERLLWKHPSEQFAFMAQQTLEVKALELTRNALQKTRADKITLAGGVASNIKMNRQIKNLPGVRDVFVFPHMGDGGQAVGAALWVNHQLNGINRYDLPNVYLGPEYGDSDIEEALRRHSLPFRRCDSIEKETARFLSEGKIVLWFQGRMEFGPRAVGHRSILARPDSEEVKMRLNLSLKKRVWYQPFCPTMLLETAREALEDLSGAPNRFMTMGYMVKKEYREKLKGVIHVDGSCRPQIVSGEDDPRYIRLLEEFRRLTGLGAVLNTSLNIHGEPIVENPEDAIRCLRQTGAELLAIGNYLVTP